MLLIFNFLVFITFNKLSFISNLPLFLGDITPQQYLKQICESGSSRSTKLNRDTVVIIEDFRGFPYLEDKKPFKRRKGLLSDLHCLNKDNLLITHLPQPTTAHQLFTQVLNSSKLKFRQLTLIFNLELLNLNSTTSFSLLLKALAKEVLNRCFRCRPLIALFDLPLKTLKSWSEEVMKVGGSLLNGKESSFQAVLVSLNQDGQPSSSIHLNPTLFGCKRKLGVYLPTSKLDYAHLATTDPSQCNLQGITLSASFNQKLPFCDLVRKAGGQTEVKFAVETELVKILQAKYNFSFSILNAKGAWGMLVKGKWTGAMGMVLNGSVDFGMCYISQTPARLAYVDFAEPIYVDELTFLSRSPGPRARHWLVLSPFSPDVWLANISLWLILTVVLFVALKVHFGRLNRAERSFYLSKRGEKLVREFKNIKKRPSILAILLQLYAIFMGQSNKLRWSDLPTVRLIYAVWVPMVLVLANSYGGCFYSILALPEFEAPIDLIDDLEEIATAKDDEKGGRLVTFDDSSYLEMFLRSGPEDGVIYEIGKHMNRTTNSRQHVTEDEESIRAIEDRKPRVTLIATRLYLATIRRVYARQPLHLGSESLNLDYTSFIFPKRSDLIDPFSLIIKRMTQTGMISRLLGATFNRLPGRSAASLDSNPTTMTTSGSSKPNPLALADLRSIFVLWSIGIALAVSSFACYESLLRLLLSRQKVFW